MTCQLFDGRPNGGDALLGSLVVNKVSACIPVGITGATQKFFSNGDIKSKSDCRIELAEL